MFFEEDFMLHGSRLAHLTSLATRCAVFCAALIPMLTLAVSSPAQTFATLQDFDFTDGQAPFTSLIQGTDGSLYGVTSEGGTDDAGTVFRINLQGTLTTLHSFNQLDGANPWHVIEATDGNLYGTARQGGSLGGGTLFEISPAGEFTVLYNFCSVQPCPDGTDPFALTQVSDGRIYGITLSGGNDNWGTVFKIAESGALTTVHSFCSRALCADGGEPFGLVAADGGLYGVTGSGGPSSDGTLFTIRNGVFTTLYNFCSQPGCTDGEGPNGLTLGNDGNLYGTTIMGGTTGYGTVFKFSPAAGLATVYSFCPNRGCTDGSFPVNPVIQGSDGNLYGTTDGGATEEGTAFRLTPQGAFTLLHSFCALPGCGDGADPQRLMEDTNGKIYGTTIYGGNSRACGTGGCGTIFELAGRLPEFVEPQLNAGEAGAPVNILGTTLSGATSVTFNGTASIFNVVSGSLITATVPAGATTGPIEVSTAHGTIRSKANFVVLE
jgi:uncharacterized repeat protein (TIGR03803 family)